MGPSHRHVALKGCREGSQVTRCTEAGAYARDFITGVVGILQATLVGGGAVFPTTAAEQKELETLPCRRGPDGGCCRACCQGKQGCGLCTKCWAQGVRKKPVYVGTEEAKRLAGRTWAAGGSGSERNRSRERSRSDRGEEGRADDAENRGRDEEAGEATEAVDETAERAGLDEFAGLEGDEYQKGGDDHGEDEGAGAPKGPDHEVRGGGGRCGAQGLLGTPGQSPDTTPCVSTHPPL